MRRLEIGPGNERLPGFETLNAVPGPFTDHVGDARNPPFRPGTFAEVYSAHCIEHLDCWEIEEVLARWAALVAPGGTLEVHTVNATPMLRAMLEWEETGETSRPAGQWKEELHRGDPFVSAQLRILNYRQKGASGHYWMHRAILTPRYLRQCFDRAGLVEIEEVAEPRGTKKHKSVNMGLRGRKP